MTMQQASARMVAAALLGTGLVGTGLAAQEEAAGAAGGAAAASPAAAESEYYRLVTVPLPEGVVLEVGGIATLPGNRVAVSTRRGDVWVIGNAYAEGDVQPTFTRFAQGLHEPLGLMHRDGALYAAQRGELTRLRDTDGDGRADRYETVTRWPLSGNYHEYAFGPVLQPDGRMMVTLNLAWVGRGASLVPWRGWAAEVTDDGQFTPFATGMRSPAGLGNNAAGDFFYTENQGDWVGSGFLSQVKRGDFVGNPEGLRWSGEPGSPVRLRPEQVPSTGEPKHVVARRVPGLRVPAVWLPHGVMGISTSDILVDSTGGRFGPFAGQLFVGDQGHSKLFRVFLEQVGGEYQGAAFPFREGFMSGVLRQRWGADGSMLVGMTNRGWNSAGTSGYGLQRLVWTGRTPFEAQKIEARPDGWEITFTQPVDRERAADPASYAVTGFTYRYHQEYGSPPVDRRAHPVRGVVVSPDGMRARVVVDSLRPGYIHEIRMEGVRAAAGGAALLHNVAYYTLNRVPEGERLNLPAPVRRPAPPRDTRPSIPVERPAAAPAAGTRPAAAATERLAKRTTRMPASWGGRADVTLNVGTRPGLRFSTERLTVKAGSRVRLVFNNSDDMLHNFVVTRPGTANAVANQAIALGLEGEERDWVPSTPSVLYHTSLLQPGRSETIYFVAPTQPGDYTFICSVPGHAVAMRGVLRVTP